MKCIVVEDEPLALERMAGYVRRLPLLDLVGTFDAAAEAFAFLKTNPVDLVFLDIRLGGWSGIEMLETRAVGSAVILTTAHQEYAAKVYDLGVTDYLVKPFTFERFVLAVDRAAADRAQAARVPVERSGARGFIFVKTGLRLERVALNEVLVIEGQRDYRRIHTLTKRVMTLQPFAEFERQIAPDVICRVHKSYMVALDKIESIEGRTIRLAGMTIPVSDTYRDRLLSMIGSPRTS